MFVQEKTITRELDASFEEKAVKLREIAWSILRYPECQAEFGALKAKLGLTDEEIVEAYVNYDLDLFAVSNDAFEPLIIRFVLHMHNYLKGSWHIDGKRFVGELVKDCKVRTIIDSGFGVPTSYVKEVLCNPQIEKLVLSDGFPSAKQFAEALLPIWDRNWQEKVELSVFDMDDGYVGDHDLYIFQDSLEHVPDSSAYLKMMLAKSPKESQFIFSLPVGPIFPMHSITWHSVEEVASWLESHGLKIKRGSAIRVAPEIDLFASQLNYNLSTYIALCEKEHGLD